MQMRSEGMQQRTILEVRKGGAKMVNLCYLCKERHIGCHASCNRGKLMDAYFERRRKQVNTYNQMFGFHHDCDSERTEKALCGCKVR